MPKEITINEEAYLKLSKAKKPKESFSDVILRFLSNKKNLSDVIGKKLIDTDISLNEIRKASRNTMDRIINK